MTSYMYVGYWVVVFIVCLKIIIDSTSPSKALAYSFLVLTFPILGIIFYFSIGVNYRKKKIFQKKLNIDKHAFPDLELKVRQFSKDIILSKKQELRQFFSLACYHSIKHTSNNNHVELLINGENKFPEVIQSIKKATHHIHLEYYIYENDLIGSEIADILIKKAKSGVEVRFIYDDFGSRRIRKKFIDRLKMAGVRSVPFYKINLVAFANRLNYRNHRKILIVDGIVGYVGGINVSDRYINGKNNELYWRDSHLKIEGMSVMNLQYIFLTDWNFCANESVGFSNNYFPIHKREEVYGEQLVQVVESGPDSEHPSIMHGFIQLVLLAQEEILITTPYFIPEKSFLDAIKIARLSGVEVKLIVPYSSDSEFVNIACKSYYEDLLEVGVKIYRYKKGFIHAKTIVCDQYVSTVGTSNLDNRSFDLNFEVNAIIYDRNLAARLKDQFLLDQENSEPISLAQWKSRKFGTKMIEKIVHLFSPLL